MWTLAIVVVIWCGLSLPAGLLIGRWMGVGMRE